MLNFELFNPTRLLYGKGQIASLSTLLDTNKKVLLAYGGGSILKNGIYNQVIESLKGFEVIEFAGIELNPKYETLMKAVELIRVEKIDFILAVGGGSVIDGVKFISAAVNYCGNTLDIVQKRIPIIWDAIPYGTVLTLPATGSEMNCGSVITIDATHEKLAFMSEKVYPQFSICDPTVIASLPKRQLANGVTDAFVHVLEQYVTYPQNAPLQDRFAESILKTLVEVGPKVVNDPTDYDAAMNFMWCCTMALNGLISKGVAEDWVTHMIGHELTALYDIDHACTLAIVGPNLYRVMLETKKEKLCQLGQRVFNLQGSNDEEVALMTIDKLVDFFHLLGIKTSLSNYTTESDKAINWIVSRFEARGWTAMGEKQNITIPKIKEILLLSI